MQQQLTPPERKLRVQVNNNNSSNELRLIPAGSISAFSCLSSAHEPRRCPCDRQKHQFSSHIRRKHLKSAMFPDACRTWSASALRLVSIVFQPSVEILPSRIKKKTIVEVYLRTLYSLDLIFYILYLYFYFYFIFFPAHLDFFESMLT